MVTLPYRYPLDPTGVNPDNKVVGEAHVLPNRTVRAIATAYGAFYSESVTITDTATGLALTTAQYKTVELLEFPTGRYGKEICSIILITDQAVSSNIEVGYQALGGEYSTHVEAIVQMLNSADFDNRPVRWPDIINKPAAFEPAFHYHDVGDIYGFEYVVHAIERVRSAILVGDSASHDEIFRYIDAQMENFQQQLDALQTNLNQHASNTSNPHQTTKGQVGLGAVENYAVASQAEAQAGAANNRYMTPERTAQAITAQIGTVAMTHINRTDNPHATTKEQVGLGLVDNFATASQTEAQAGSVNDKFMTPLRTAQAITTQAGALIQSHVSNTNNPHAVTKAQVGLGSVQNYGMANNTDADTGTRTDVYSSPGTVQVQVNKHATRTDNPHQTTAAQVGLGQVMNWRPATAGEAQQYAMNEAYMTPYLTGVAMNQFYTNSIQPHLTNLYNADAQIWGSLNGHTGNYSNPHATTAAQVGAYTSQQTEDRITARLAQSTQVGFEYIDIGAAASYSFVAAQRGWCQLMIPDDRWRNTFVYRNGTQVSWNIKAGSSGYGRIHHDAVMFSAGDTISFSFNTARNASLANPVLIRNYF